VERWPTAQDASAEGVIRHDKKAVAAIQKKVHEASLVHPTTAHAPYGLARNPPYPAKNHSRKSTLTPVSLFLK
jgi:hypothetical protein